MLKVILKSDEEMFDNALLAALSGAPVPGECRLVDVDHLEEEIDAADDRPLVLILHASDLIIDQLVDLAGNARILVLGSGDPQEMISAVDNGAMGYLRADAPFEVIVDAVTSLVKGVATVDPSLLGALLRHVVERRRAEAEVRTTLEVLTPREDEIFRLLAKGLDSQRVAERLFISIQTVRTHSRRIMDKLDLHSRSELIALAARCGLDLNSDWNGK